MRVDFAREKRWWIDKAADEEQDLGDEQTNRALRWREIERRLGGVQSILEVGGSTGVFSIPLAQRGFAVTHLDFSPTALDIARQRAEGLQTIEFVDGNAADLPFGDRSFDLVLNMDGAISFCGSEAERAVREACRVARGTVILTVSHRASLARGWVDVSVKCLGRLCPAVYEMLGSGFWHRDQFPENRVLAKGCPQDYVGTIKAFLPEELGAIVGDCGMEVVRLGGLGSLAHLCYGETLARVMGDSRLFEEFVSLAERYDLEVSPQGPGSYRRAGLIAVGERPQSCQ